MATPAERKALLFVGTVAVLGGGVRVWQSQHHASGYDRSNQTQDRRDSLNRSDRAGYSDHNSTAKNRHYKSASQNGRSKRDKPHDQPILETTPLVDLDRASVAEIEAIGVLKPGVARMIVEDREKFGPFGAIQELERVPYLSRYALRALAPRVTFSFVPRPKNAVFPGRPDTSAASPPVSGNPKRRRTSHRTSQAGTP